MRNLNQVELSAIAGCRAAPKSNAVTIGLGLSLLSFAVLGVQKVMIDALKPMSSGIVDVNTLTSYCGGGYFGSPEHVTCMATTPVAIGVVLGLSTIGAIAHSQIN